MRLSLVFGSIFLAVSTLSLAGQQADARDTFWSAADLVSVSVSSNPGAKPTAHVVPSKKRPMHSANGQLITKAESGQHVDPVLVAQRGYGEQPRLTRVSTDQIGLRYSLLLRTSDGTYKEVSPSAVFHSGDHLRLSVMANQPGFLYVIAQGSTGNWSPIFPPAGSAKEVNKVTQGQIHELPDASHTFQFDPNPGQERLFIVLSRQPIQDLDSTIENLKRPGTEPPRQTEPATQPEIYQASNHIPNELLESLASRDLTLVQEQQVDEADKGKGPGEKAVYVVSKGAASGVGPQVVASVTLRHE